MMHRSFRDNTNSIQHAAVAPMELPWTEAGFAPIHPRSEGTESTASEECQTVVLIDDRGVMTMPTDCADRWFGMGAVICRRIYGAVVLVPAHPASCAAVSLRVSRPFGTTRVDIHEIIGDAFVAGRRRVQWDPVEGRLTVPLVA